MLRKLTQNILKYAPRPGNQELLSNATTFEKKLLYVSTGIVLLTPPILFTTNKIADNVEIPDCIIIYFMNPTSVELSSAIVVYIFV